MKVRALVFVVVLALTLTGVGVVAAGGGTELRAVTDGAVTLYAEPNANADVVAELGAYSIASLLATDESGAWLQVSAAEGDGWVMASDVLVMNLPLLAPKVYVSTGQAGATGIYAEPSFSAAFLTSLNDGAVATVLATKGEWAFILSDAGLGWSVASAWEALPDDAYPALVSLGATPEMGVFTEAMIGADVAATVPDGAAVWVLSAVDEQWVEVLTASGAMGYALASNFEPLPGLMVDAVAGSNANPALYDAPDFGANVVASLEDGTSLTYVAAVDDFWVELYHPAHGMAYGLANNFGPVYTAATVQQADAIVREGPNDNIYNAVAQLPAGTQVIAKGLSASGVWVEVALPFSEVDYGYNGLDGWMRDFLFVDAQGNSSLDLSVLEVTE